MHLGMSLLLVLILLAVVWVGVGAIDLHYLFGVIIPYAAIVTFMVGAVYRIVKWARSAVPFRIPTTCGQQKSLDWIKPGNLEAPHSTWGVIKRMALEVLLFRSLFRNTKAELHEGNRLTYGSSKWLWLGGLAFHYSFLVIFIRHFKFFAEPVPGFVQLAETLDGFFQVGLPIVFITDIIIVLALGYLFLRRVVDPKLRYISLAADYFPLFLLGSIVTSGICVRYFAKTDIVVIKQLGMGLISFNPPAVATLEQIGVTFFIHLFFISVLFAYFPFSKLMHFAGVFFSPTRNQSNDSRVRRHVNPWPLEVKFHTYEEYEEEFHDVMKAAGLPLEKE